MAQVGFNTQLGIQLAQQGRKPEALPYLRHAVMTEPVNAEVWLWLAYVSPDLAEYRNCVHQALIVDPTHPTALRMQQDLDFQARGLPPPIVAPLASQAMESPHARGKSLRRVLILLIAIFLVVGCGLLFNRLSQEFDSRDLNAMLPFDEPTKRIQFAVGSETDAYGFAAEVPRTWFLADSGSPSWRKERDRLQSEFPNAAEQPNLWHNLEADLGEVQPDSVTGELLGSVAIVETDSAKIKPYYPTIASAVLVAIQPAKYGDTTCESMRLMAGEAEALNKQNAGFIGTQVKQRDSRDCIYYSEFTTEGAEDIPALHVLQLAIPVQNAEIAFWEVRLPEAQYPDYQASLDKFIARLRFVEPTP